MRNFAVVPVIKDTGIFYLRRLPESSFNVHR